MSCGSCFNRIADCLRQSHCPNKAPNDGGITWPGQDAGFLGRAADPWLINCEPEKGKFEVPGLELPADVTQSRFDGRKGLLAAARFGEPRPRATNTHAARFEMISSPARVRLSISNRRWRSRPLWSFAVWSIVFAGAADG